MEIIYVSSDNTQTEFHDYYQTMPWLAMAGDTTSAARLKHNLATKLSVFKLPTLIVLNVQTGNFVTDQARQEILNLITTTTTTTTATEKKNDSTANKKEEEDGEDDTDNKKRKELLKIKGKELVESWKTRDPEKLGTQDSTMDTLARGLAYLVNHPMIAIAAICLLVFTNTIQRLQENPLLLVGFWLIFKKMAQEPLSRNEPYMAQTPSSLPVPTKDNDNDNLTKKATKKNN